MDGKPSRSLSADEFYAETYDACVPDWPGEIDFYQALAAEATARGQAVLEVACGTGRVAIRLAQSGARVVGLDRSRLMLDIARRKSHGQLNPVWAEADMRDFELGERFGLIIVPGHSFQNLVTLDDQLRAMRAIRHHLAPGGVQVLHLDQPGIDWLGEIAGSKKGVPKPAEVFLHPVTGRHVNTSRAWSYEPATQTAVASTVWEEVDQKGEVVRRIERGPSHYHCFFPCEVRHLFALSGFEVSAVFGDFFCAPHENGSEEMIWVAARHTTSNDLAH